MLKRLLAIVAAALLIPASAFAASNEMFRGKTITYIVSTTAGGGYDTYGRMIARYMPKYLPGARMIVSVGSQSPARIWMHDGEFAGAMYRPCGSPRLAE